MNPESWREDRGRKCVRDATCPIRFHAVPNNGAPMRAIAVLALLTLAACDSRTLVVESDTSWDGGIFGPQGSTWVEGSGDARFPLGNGRHCWAFNAHGGTVRVFVETTSVTGTDGAADEGAAVEGCTA